MATYGSTLDSLMANRIGQQAADAAEQNAYRNYLNAVANTNIRRTEGEALDRYRQGELGIRGQDVMGMNEYRRGQLGLGGRQLDVQSELNKGTIANQMEDIRNRAKYYEGMGQYYGAQPGVQREEIGVKYALGKQGLENQALDIGGSNRYREGLISNQASDIGGSNQYRQGLINVSRLQAGTQAADVAARNQIAADVARMNYELGGRQLTTQKEIASLPYDRTTADRLKLYELMLSDPNINKTPEERMFDLSQQQEDRNAYRTAVLNAMPRYIDQYASDTSPWAVFGLLNPNDPSTDAIQKLMAEQRLTVEDAARLYAQQQLAPLYLPGTAAAPSKPAPVSPKPSGSNRIPAAVIQPLASANVSEETPAMFGYDLSQTNWMGRFPTNGMGRFFKTNQTAIVPSR